MASTLEITRLQIQAIFAYLSVRNKQYMSWDDMREYISNTKDEELIELLKDLVNFLGMVINMKDIISERQYNREVNKLKPFQKFHRGLFHKESFNEGINFIQNIGFNIDADFYLTPYVTGILKYRHNDKKLGEIIEIVKNLYDDVS